MTTLTLDLPDELVRRLRERDVTEDEIRAIARAALELWLAQSGQPSGPMLPEGGRFSQSAL